MLNYVQDAKMSNGSWNNLSKMFVATRMLSSLNSSKR